MIERVSTYAGDVDHLILFMAVVVGFWFFLCEFIFLGLILKFRHQPGRRAEYITGEEQQYKRWISRAHMLVLVCDVFILVGAVHVWVKIKQTLPPADATVRVMGQQWTWSFVHPGPDGELDTPDDIATVDDLHIQVGKLYHFELAARDVLHSFSVPVFRLKQDAIPGRVINGWFEATRTGSFDIQCAEICGIGHGLMAGRVVVESPEQHAAWMAGRTNTSLAALTPR
jgi:cytochrome c oxidase subunit 2